MEAARTSAWKRSGGVGLELAGATLSYDGRALFDGLDLTLPAGGFTCLLGPSGVGKSSLLRLIADLAPEASAQRLAADDGLPLAGRIAWMDQRDVLFPWLTLLENVTLGARLRGERPDLERARALLARVGLEGRERDRPAALSGGMRQRAALARTLMEDRPIVLMDEPFSAVDALSRLKLQELAAELLEGRTVLLVTHDPMEALRIADRIHVLAGAPARLDQPIRPPGAAPRPPGDPRLVALYRDLLHRLGADGAP